MDHPTLKWSYHLYFLHHRGMPESQAEPNFYQHISSKLHFLSFFAASSPIYSFSFDDPYFLHLFALSKIVKTACEVRKSWFDFPTVTTPFGSFNGYFFGIDSTKWIKNQPTVVLKPFSIKWPPHRSHTMVSTYKNMLWAFLEL